MTGPSPTRSPQLGVVLLDPGDGRPDDFAAEAGTEGDFQSPLTWRIPTTVRVARGATVEATIGGEPVAWEGLAAAVSELAETCDLVTADCGFFWQARAHHGSLPGATLLSGLDLLELAGLITNRPIGVLTFDGPRCEQILAPHPLNARLRIVGVRHQPSWAPFGDSPPSTGYAVSYDALRSELVQVLDETFKADLADVGVVVLECTVFPRFRSEVRARTTAPILDVVSLIRGALA